MKADLHIHSKFSDGTLWPDEIIRIAANKKLDMIALTDHDTFEGVGDLLKEAEKYDINAIAAVEIDFVDNDFGFNSELLGYFPAGSYKNTKNYLSHFQKLRKQLALQSLNKANSLYSPIKFTLDELLDQKLRDIYPSSIKGKVSITKVDIYKYLLGKVQHTGFADYMHFKSVFFEGNQFAELLAKPGFKRCIEMINVDSGYAVLAHPGYQYDKDTRTILSRKAEIVRSLQLAKNAGLWGIELHPYDEPNEAARINAIFRLFAEECNLYVTVGSDYHGDIIMSNRAIGCLKYDFKGFHPK